MEGVVRTYNDINTFLKDLPLWIQFPGVVAFFLLFFHCVAKYTREQNDDEWISAINGDE